MIGGPEPRLLDAKAEGFKLKQLRRSMRKPFGLVAASVGCDLSGRNQSLPHARQDIGSNSLPQRVSNKVGLAAVIPEPVTARRWQTRRPTPPHGGQGVTRSGFL
jgi:hypothetical protein